MEIDLPMDTWYELCEGVRIKLYMKRGTLRIAIDADRSILVKRGEQVYAEDYSTKPERSLEGKPKR